MADNTDYNSVDTLMLFLSQRKKDRINALVGKWLKECEKDVPNFNFHRSRMTKTYRGLLQLLRLDAIVYVLDKEGYRATFDKDIAALRSAHLPRRPKLVIDNTVKPTDK
jgi:hypothetical protein